MTDLNWFAHREPEVPLMCPTGVPQARLLPGPTVSGASMEIIDQKIRDELAARIESDPDAVFFVTAKAAQGRWTAAAVISAFVGGLVLGSFL